ncbi:tyrosine-type recombinase/integrase [Myxococcota bacterium]
MTLRDQMIEAMTLRGHAETTQLTYLSCVAKMARHFGKSPADLKTEDLKEYWLSLVKRLQAGSLSTEHSAIKFLYDHVLKRPWVLKDISAPKRCCPTPVLLSRDEMQRLIAAARNVRGRTIMMLLYGAGLRVSEGLRLHASHIDSERRLIHIQKSKCRRSRCVMLGEELLIALRTWWKARPNIYNTDLLFPGSHGNYTFTDSGVRKLVRTAARRAGIKKKVHPHTLRHCFATHLLEDGIDIRTIQVLLGHANIRNTTRYLTLTTKHIAKVKSPLDSAPSPRPE